MFEDAGLLLLASGAIAAMLLVVAVSLAALRYGVLPRWLGWAGLPAAALLPLAVAFVGFLVPLPGCSPPPSPWRRRTCPRRLSAR